MVEDNMICTFDYKTLIDIKNKDDITKCVDDVTKYFLDHKDNYLPKANDKLIFFYMDKIKTVYQKHLKLVKKKFFKLKLVKILNLLRISRLMLDS